MHKIFWTGRQAASGDAAPITSPLGKVHAEGLALLRERGWVKVQPDTQLVPVFAFTTRHGEYKQPRLNTPARAQ